jgi:hypothetical protein
MLDPGPNDPHPFAPGFNVPLSVASTQWSTIVPSDPTTGAHRTSKFARTSACSHHVNPSASGVSAHVTAARTIVAGRISIIIIPPSANARETRETRETRGILRPSVRPSVRSFVRPRVVSSDARVNECTPARECAFEW